MKIRTLNGVIFGLLLGITVCTTSVQAADTAGAMQRNYSVPDVIEAFDALTKQGEWLGYHMNDEFNLDFTDNESRHIQGIARSPRTGVPPVFYVTHSTNTNSLIEYAGIMVAELGSRPTNGERLRSNRLKRGAETTDTKPPLDTATEPPEADWLINSVEDHESHHPSGISMVGDILVVPSGGKLFFYNSWDLEPSQTGVAPKPVYTLIHNKGDACPENPSDEQRHECHGAQGVGITRTPAGRFLLVTNDNDGAHFHWSTSTEDLIDKSGGPAQISVNDPDEACETEYEKCIDECQDDEDCKKACKNQRCAGCPDEFCAEYFTEFFDGYQFVPRAEIVDAAGNHGYWPIKGVGESTKALQAVSLVDQIDKDGNYRLFLIGSCNSQEWATKTPGNDELYLLEVVQVDADPKEVKLDLSKLKNGETLKLKGLRKEVVKSLANPGSWETFWHYAKRKNGNFNAGGGAYVSPSRELLYYGVSHWNDGPGDIVKIAELRHNHVVRDGSPTYATTAIPGGPYEVNEGDSIQLNGSLSHAPTAAPWVHLFEDISFGGHSVMVDYEDRALDDYDDFSKLDEQPWFCGDDWCLDPADVSDLTTRMNSFKENELDTFLDNLTSLNVDDFFYENYCYGVRIDGTCYTVPPVVNEDDCKDACNEVFNVAKKVCRLGGSSCCSWFVCIPGCKQCVDAAETVRDGCKTGCETGADGVPGLEAYFPNFDGIADTLETFYNDLESMIETSTDIVDSMVLNVENIDPHSRILDKLERWPSLVPPLPEFEFLSDEYWAYDLTDLKDVDPEKLVKFVEDKFTGAVGEIEDYFKSYAATWEDFLLSLEGFNDQASAVRWYAPTGVDIVLYSKAEYGGSSMFLNGDGTVRSVKFTDSLSHWNDRVRSVKFEGTFDQSTLERFQWNILSPSPSDPLTLVSATLVNPTFDATAGDGPTEAVVELEVEDSGWQSGRATTTVQVLNVAPEVQIDRIEDQTGKTIDDSLLPVLLEALEYDLFGSFTDVGVLDTHTAEVDWGDDLLNDSGEERFLITDCLNGETGTVNVPHAYALKGLYTITLTVEDDDGGSGLATREVEVVNAAVALKIMTKALSDERNKVSGSSKGMLGMALNSLQGRLGALGLLRRGKPAQAQLKIETAMRLIEIAEQFNFNLDLSEIKERLALIAKSPAAAAIAKAEQSASRPDEIKRIEKAKHHLSKGDELVSMGKYVEAVLQYHQAIIWSPWNPRK